MTSVYVITPWNVFTRRLALNTENCDIQTKNIIKWSDNDRHFTVWFRLHFSSTVTLRATPVLMKPGSFQRKNHDSGKHVIYITQPFQAAAAVQKQNRHCLRSGVKWFSFAWEESHLMSRLLVWCLTASEQANAAARPFGHRALATTTAALWVNKRGNTKLRCSDIQLNMSAGSVCYSVWLLVCLNRHEFYSSFIIF